MGFVEALRAVWDTGDAAAPLDPRLPEPARQSLLAALRPTRVVGSDGEFHRLSDGLGVDDGDALVMATSGSSGEPRGVVLTHDALAASARATSDRLGIDPDRHAWLACLPLAHVGGLSVVTRALLTDTALTVLPGFDPASVERLGRTGAATHVSLVTTSLGRIDPALFIGILLGGSRPPEWLPPNVVATYGMTETGSGVVYDGVPLDGVELALAHFGESDSGGSDGGSGRNDGDGDGDGEILIRAPMLMRCYRDESDGRVAGPDGTRSWFATGDVGYIKTDGELGVRGRMAEVIVTGGEKVWPDSVERVLATAANVAEVAVWKRSDPEWGERVVAWIVPVEGRQVAPDELVALVKETLSPWAAPKEIVMATELPRTGSGKVRRAELQ
jgi:O-succinylbenzoic acid--CoA ligase